MVTPCVAANLATAAGACCPAAAACITAATGCRTAPASITSSATVAEAMTTPTVAIAPAGPRTHAQKDAAIKVSRPVKSIGRAGVRFIVVIAVRTDGWNADVYDDLSPSRWRQSQAR